MTLPKTLPMHLPNSLSPAASPAAILAARGYQVSAEASSLALAPVCALALHFGDQLTRSAEGMPELTIRAGLDAGAGATPSSPATMHWTLRKSDLRFARGERIRLRLEIDLFLSNDTNLDNLHLELRPAAANLARLVGDARTLLNGLVTDKTSEGHRGPVLRLEARFVGDLFTGRCGLISAGRAPMSFRHQAASLAGCDWLKQTILPELAASLRGQPPQAETVADATPGATRPFTHVNRRGELAMAVPPR
ncbi:MAG: hypothetical protein WDN02_12920 [Methylovirgula sp.]|uniref:hypothetical protein n=1 Tax=Methylovirgula sp. TaxID=1978224 RepID=UPI0030763179